jgi:hypothetical protein
VLFYGRPEKSALGQENSRSLHYATPDLLWNFVALTRFMHPSLRKGARVPCLVMRGRKSGYASVGMTILFETGISVPKHPVLVQALNAAPLKNECFGTPKVPLFRFRGSTPGARLLCRAWKARCAASSVPRESKECQHLTEAARIQHAPRFAFLSAPES